MSNMFDVKEVVYFIIKVDCRDGKYPHYCVHHGQIRGPKDESTSSYEIEDWTYRGSVQVKESMIFHNQDDAQLVMARYDWEQIDAISQNIKTVQALLQFAADHPISGMQADPYARAAFRQSAEKLGVSLKY